MTLSTWLTKRAVLLLALLFAFAGVANASTIYNNLNSTTGGANSVYLSGPLADSFSTGSSAFFLDQVTLDLSALVPGDGGSILVQLLSSSSAPAPGSVLDTIGTLEDSQLTTNLEDYSLTLSTAYTLTADTTYWIELSTSNASSAAWAFSLDQTAQGVAGQFFYHLGMVIQNTGGPYQMELSGTPETAAEPGSLLLLGLVILCGLGGLGAERKRLFSLTR